MFFAYLEVSQFHHLAILGSFPDQALLVCKFRQLPVYLHSHLYP